MVEQYDLKQYRLYSTRSAKENIFRISKEKEIPNMLLSVTQNSKTTVARALCDELNADYIIINGSMKVGILIH